MSDIYPYTMAYNTLVFATGAAVTAAIPLRPFPFFAVSSISYSLPLLPLAYRIGAAAIAILVATDPPLTGIAYKAHEKAAAFIAGSACTYCASPQNSAFTLFNFAQSIFAIGLGIIVANRSVRIFYKDVQASKKH